MPPPTLIRVNILKIVLNPKDVHGAPVDQMTRKLFQQFLHINFNMTDDVLLDQIFKYFNSQTDASINREEWIIGFEVFLKGSEDEQTRYCFKIYDINGDGFITKEEMLTLMKDCMVRHGAVEEEGDGDEGVKVRNKIEILFISKSCRHSYRALKGPYQKI